MTGYSTRYCRETTLIDVISRYRIIFESTIAGRYNTRVADRRDMAGNSASLLTKTQRNRIRNDFADLDEAKKHRDQQRIRERVRSGLLDFELLSEYPDR